MTKQNFSSSHTPQQNNATSIKFLISKEHLRRFDFHDGDNITIYHLYPTLDEWMGKAFPEEINPRSHDGDMMTSNVAKGIASTIRENPKDFILANRGATIIAETVRFDPTKNEVEIIIADTQDQGLADGGTSDAVIAFVQQQVSQDKKFKDLSKDEIPDFLKHARFHIEVIVGIKDRERIGALAQGRNTSRQVRSWSMASFQKAFDWIKEILEHPSSKYKDRIGYEENAARPSNILDVLSVMTLFSKEWDDKDERLKRKAPTVAYSSKGRMDARFQDEKLSPYYEALSLILEDILSLHDYVYVNFEDAYKAAMGGGKLGSRRGVEVKKTTLPFTGQESRLEISSGFIFPLLASLRALVSYDDHGKAKWETSPTEFFDLYGAELISVLIEQIEGQGNNPQSAGKSKAIYTSLHDRAKILLSDHKEKAA